MCASSFFFISAKLARVSAWSLVEKKQGSFARMACLYVIVCVVVFQNANFEGQNRRRPSVNSKSVSHKKSFLRSLGLLGNESQLLSEDFHSAGLQRISFIISTVKLSARVLKRLCVPAVSSSFQPNWQEFQPEALLKKNRWVLQGWLVCMSLCASLFFKTLTLNAKIGEGHRWTVKQEMNLNCLSEDFHSAGLQRISFIISTVKLSARVLNRLCVPAVSSSYQPNWQEFQPEALLKKNGWVCKDGLFVCHCVRRCFQNANFEGQNRRRPSVNSKSVSHKKSFLRSLGLLGNESQLLSEDFHSAGLQRISFIISTVKLSARVLNRLCVPAVSSSFQLNWQEFQPEA